MSHNAVFYTIKTFLETFTTWGTRCHATLFLHYDNNHFIKDFELTKSQNPLRIQLFEIIE